MSRPTKAASTATATFWNCTGVDEFGRKSYGAPFTVKCCIDAGSHRAHTTSKGVQIIPMLKAWFEFDGFLPSEGDMMARGDNSAIADPAAAGAHPVKDVVLQDCSSLRQADDVMVVI